MQVLFSGHLCKNDFSPQILLFRRRWNQNMYIIVKCMLSFINKPATSLFRKARRYQFLSNDYGFPLYVPLSFWHTVDQKRSVTFIEAQPAQPELAGAPTDTLPATVPLPGCSPAPPGKPEGMDKPILTSSPAIVVADLHRLSPKQVRVLENQARLAPCILMSRNHVDVHMYGMSVKSRPGTFC